MLQGAALRFPGGPAMLPPGQDGIVGVDFNDDFKLDLAFAGAGGVALFRQDTAGAFTDVTAHVALPEEVTAAPYTGVWTADIDMEGDLDLVLGTPQGPPLMLRNNGDGTFTALHLFDEVVELQAFSWGDVDADGDPTPPAGRERDSARVCQRTCRAVPGPRRAAGGGKVLALALADVNSDSVLDIVVLRRMGTYNACRRRLRARYGIWCAWPSGRRSPVRLPWLPRACWWRI